MKLSNADGIMRLENEKLRAFVRCPRFLTPSLVCAVVQRMGGEAAFIREALNFKTNTKVRMAGFEGENDYRLFSWFFYPALVFCYKRLSAKHRDAWAWVHVLPMRTEFGDIGRKAELHPEHIDSVMAGNTELRGGEFDAFDILESITRREIFTLLDDFAVFDANYTPRCQKTFGKQK